MSYLQRIGNLLDWEAILDNVVNASKKQNHSCIHIKFCLLAYVTPRIRQIKWDESLIHIPVFAQKEPLAPLYYMMWECPEVLWKKVIDLAGVQFQWIQRYIL